MSSKSPSKTTLRTAKLILQRMRDNVDSRPATPRAKWPKDKNGKYRRRPYANIDRYLTNLKAHDRDMIRQLARHENGLDTFLRALVKDHMTREQFEAMYQDAEHRGMFITTENPITGLEETHVDVNQWGGRKTRRRR